MNLWINTAPGPRAYDWLAGSRPDPQHFPGQWEDADAIVEERDRLREQARRPGAEIPEKAIPQPEGDMVVVPREKLDEFVAWAIDAGESLDSYQTSRHMMDAADHARSLAATLRPTPPTNEGE